MWWDSRGLQEEGLEVSVQFNVSHDGDAVITVTCSELRSVFRSRQGLGALGMEPTEPQATSPRGSPATNSDGCWPHSIHSKSIFC